MGLKHLNQSFLNTKELAPVCDTRQENLTIYLIVTKCTKNRY